MDKNTPNKVATNTVIKAKKSSNSKIHLIPDDLNKNLNRRQRKRIIHKLVRTLKSQGTEDISTIDSSNASVKEIFGKLSKKEESKASTKKQPVEKTPKKSPKTN